jgi:hypothetical protein
MCYTCHRFAAESFIDLSRKVSVGRYYIAFMIQFNMGFNCGFDIYPHLEANDLNKEALLTAWSIWTLGQQSRQYVVHPAGLFKVIGRKPRLDVADVPGIMEV